MFLGFNQSSVNILGDNKWAGISAQPVGKKKVLAVADGDIIMTDNPAQIASSKATVEESTKADIFLDMDNDQKYMQLKDDFENEFSNDIYTYPLTVERDPHLLNAYKIKFDYTKKGVNLISDENEVAFIEHG